MTDYRLEKACERGYKGTVGVEADDVRILAARPSQAWPLLVSGGTKERF
jgi:hypothetical protein